MRSKSTTTTNPPVTTSASAATPPARKRAVKRPDALATGHSPAARVLEEDAGPRQWPSDGALTGRGGRSPSVFGRGGLQLVLLQLISTQTSHGYELIKAIEDSLQGRYSPSPGVVYPRLAMLEDMGYIVAQAPDTQGRRRYSITAPGRRFLKDQQQRVQELMARMSGGVDGAGLRGGRPAPVARAIETLKMAMRLRLAEPLGHDQALAFAAILDEATYKIERLPPQPTVE